MNDKSLRGMVQLMCVITGILLMVLVTGFTVNSEEDRLMRIAIGQHLYSEKLRINKLERDQAETDLFNVEMAKGLNGMAKELELKTRVQTPGSGN